MPMSAIALLKDDHEKIKGLLQQLVDTTERAQKKRRNLLQKIEHELHVHTTIEEELFYPAFKRANGKEHAKMFFEALEEHRAAEKLVLPDLKRTKPATEKFSGRAKVLKELIEHHADEEEDEMFPEAEKSMDKDLLKELGKQMAARKKQLK